MQTLVTLFQAAKGYRTYAAGIAAALAQLGPLLGMFNSSTAQSLSMACVGLAVVFHRMATEDHVTLQDVEDLVSTVTTPPTPPSAPISQVAVPLSSLLYRSTTTIPPTPEPATVRDAAPLTLFNPPDSAVA